MGTNNSTKTQQIASDTKVLGGLQKHQASLPPSWNILGKPFALAEIVAMFQGRLSKVAAADEDRAEWQTSLADARQEVAETKPNVDAVKQQLQIWYGNAVNTLADFGLAPKKRPGPPSPATQVVAAAKRKATRDARHTMGKVQKRRIKGAVPETVSIATATEEVSSGAPSPAAATASELAKASSPATPANASSPAVTKAS